MANYTVKYYQQNLDNDEYVLKSTETKTGQIGTTVVAPEKETGEGQEYYGFTKPNPSTQTITEDGLTVVDYKYNRRYFTVNFIVGEHGEAPPSPQTVKYQSTLTEPTAPSQAGFVFSGWYKDTSYLAQ